MKLQSFKKTYGGRLVLNMPEYEFQAGCIYAVLGANGSGKSTLARVMAGTVKPDGGGSPMEKINIGYMPQKCYAFRMTAMRNMLLGGGDAEDARKLLSALGLSELEKSRAGTMSGGETQKLCLGRLLMRERGMLILDEPTASMDVESVIAAEGLIDEYRRRANCAVILITHSPQQAYRLADEALFFHRGELEEHGECKRMIESPGGGELVKYLRFCQN